MHSCVGNSENDPATSAISNRKTPSQLSFDLPHRIPDMLIQSQLSKMSPHPRISLYLSKLGGDTDAPLV